MGRNPNNRCLIDNCGRVAVGRGLCGLHHQRWRKSGDPLVCKQRVTHGHSRRKTKSGEYVAWLSMRQRCENPKTIGYHRYGGRGIKVCQRWADSFEAFFTDVGQRPSKKHSLERLDNQGNYEPGNVKWATKFEQQRNMRSNRYITLDGVTKCARQWALDAGIVRPDTMFSRLAHGWDERAAIFTPPIAAERKRAGRPPEARKGSAL